MTKEEKQQEAYKQIENKLAMIKQLQDECVEIGHAFEVEFKYPAPEGSYGMGGRFDPNNYEDYNGWWSSTQSCS